MKHKNYSTESRRLETFDLWPDNSPVSPRFLAIAGFFCIDDKTVVCFNCGGHFSDWKAGDNPFVRHVSEQKDCEFARNLQAGPSDVPNNDATQGQTQQPVMESTGQSSNSWLNQSKDLNSFELYESNHTKCHSQCPKDLNTEVHRLHTFTDWPQGTPVTPARLAKEGFFYLGDRDRVECAFCGGVLCNWEFGDNPTTEHKRHYSSCPFVRGMATRNVPLDDDRHLPLDNANTAQRMNLNSSGRAETEDGCLGQPRHPELSLEQDRFATFSRWPRHGLVSPRRLARAGFYYTGTDDAVRCFYCEGGLRDWQAGDDPWTEHNRWYGTECGFVHQQQGLTNTTPVRIHSHQVGQEQQHEGISTTTPEEQQQNRNYQRNLEQQVNDAMDSKTVQNIIEMGFGPDEIRRVVYSQIRANGKFSATMHEVIQALLDMDDELQDPPPTDEGPRRKPPIETQEPRRTESRNTSDVPVGAERPNQPDFADEQSRLSTFHNWPRYSPLSPLRLVEAGFLYTHVADHVRCFWCDGGLKDWQPDDDPWEEHARWYGSECGYVIMNKGMDYIREVRTRRPPVVQQPQYRWGIEVGIIQTVLDMGFDEDRVQAVVQNQWQRHNRPFTTATELLTAFLGLPQEEVPFYPPNKEEEEPPFTFQNAPIYRPAPNPEPVEEQPLDPETMERELRRLREERQCKVCLFADACMVFIPCGHLCCCEHCANMLRMRGRRCPLCRALFQRVQRASFA